MTYFTKGLKRLLASRQFLIEMSGIQGMASSYFWKSQVFKTRNWKQEITWNNLFRISESRGNWELPKRGKSPFWPFWQVSDILSQVLEHFWTLICSLHDIPGACLEQKHATSFTLQFMGKVMKIQGLGGYLNL